VTAIQRHLRENGRPEVNFVNKFNPTYDLLSAKMKQLELATQEKKFNLLHKKWKKRREFSFAPQQKGWYSCKLFGCELLMSTGNLCHPGLYLGNMENSWKKL